MYVRMDFMIHSCPLSLSYHPLSDLSGIKDILVIILTVMNTLYMQEICTLLL